MKTLTTAFLVVSLLYPSLQAKESPRLFYVGHATVLIEGKDINLLTDPFFGDRILWGLKRKIPPAIKASQIPKIDVVLISHTHPDHVDLDSFQQLPDKPTVVFPKGRGGKWMRRGFPTIELRPWETINLKSVNITAVPARHMWGPCRGYLIELEGTKIYFTGDTKLFPDLTRLKEEKIDVMLMPYGGFPFFGSIWTTDQALQAVQRVQPRLVIPVHWGTFGRWWTRREPVSPHTFCDGVKKLGLDTLCEVLMVGDEKSFRRSPSK